ncbi:MAG TPA: SDR family NAD(P)-dependent oxidoreductase, partial [Blastocatellia bacterium]|nr:SDR family NAD(P)-dependent oxidoreductase [Blastocatellia bacterium]
MYLITGGLGSMGLAFARSLASEARAKLILLGRTGLLPADQWDAAALFNRLDFDLATDATAIQSWEAAAEEAVGLRDIDAEEALTMDLRALCSSLIGKYFSESGVNVQQGTVYHRDELQNRLGILPMFKRFFGLLLRSLAEDGIVEIDAESIRFVNFDRLEEAQTVRQRLLAAYPEFNGLVKLLEHCAGHYREALSGAIKSISVLYPDGTAAFMNECGQQTSEYARDRIYLKLASQLVAAIQQQSTGSKLRILEVGGGTGGLTRHVLGALANHDIEYHFTDLGQTFVRDAEEEAAADGIDCMQFGVLDISQDPQPQGYRKQSYDILLGYNVVHATRDIAATTKHLHSLLSPNGVLLLVEATRLRRWDEMIWGLTEGWWHFTDEQLRIDSPLLSLDAWDQLLRKEGFQTVESYPRDQGKRSTTDAGILIAQRSRPQRDASPRPLADLESSGKTREAIAKVKEIEQLGGEVLVIQADVADQQQMRAALSQVLERFGELHGVIHTAGILGQGLIQTKTAADAQQVLAPKVTGTLILDAILKEQGIEPDFFVYCSSLAALAPIVGQVDYCAANAFLDAFAAYQAQHSDRPAIAIDWGFWQELGMIGQAKMSSESKRQIVKEIREKGWSNAGVEAFRCILASCTSAQVVVSPAKMEDLLAGDPAGDQRPGSPNGKPSIRVESDNGNAAGRSQEEPLSRPVDHPLFDECLVEGTARESYVSHFDVRRHWVLNEHRVMGKAVLPGTGYLELARAAFEAHAQGDPIELREVYFLSPLIVEEGETKEVRTILSRRISGFEFVVVSRLRADRDEWQEHARGEISRVLAANSPRHDVQAVSRGCDQPEIMVGKDKAADTATGFEARVQQFPPRWRNFKRLRFGSQQGVATLELSAEFARELESYKLHPALMDMATGFLSIHDEFDRGLPFSYQRIRIWQPLGPVINSYARSVAHDRPDERKYDVTIMDDAGRELVDVQGYTLREFDDEDHSEQSPSHELEAAVSSDDDRNFCVEIDSPGSLSTLAFRAAERRKPGPGEVEIEVCEAGLNFIEVLYALGMLPEPPGGGVKFGLECAGKIAALGEGVTDFHVGDEVFAFAQPAFSRFVTSSTAAIGRKPPHLTFAEAATIPAAFTTAYYSLITQGRLKPGERVLIHAAAGGVGLAAVNIAQWRDAEIFVTAGTPEKREYLRSVGIAHVMDSRSLDFAKQVLQATDGQGVDVVLNSLGGEFIKASLNVLARYGRFLELGKRDIFQNTPLEMAPFEKHLSFMAIDIGTDLPDFKSLWRDVVAQVQCQVFRPLPHQTFPVTRLTDAFEYMAGAKHIGKIVVKIDAVQKAALLSRGLSHRSTGRPLRAIIGGDETMRPKAGIQKEQGGAAASRLEESQAGASRPDPSHARPALKTAFREPCGETEQMLVK